jgi:tol-pal system protein YbgF
VIRIDPARHRGGRRGHTGRGAVVALSLVSALAIGCVTPGVQGIQSDLDSIQEQLFRVQKENAEMAEKLAALRDAPIDPAAGGPTAPEVSLRLEAIERDLAALGLRHDQTDQRLSALVQDLRSTREALQTLLLAAPRATGGSAAADDAAAVPGTEPGVDPGARRPPPAAGIVAPPGAEDEADRGEPGIALEDLFEQGYSDYQKENYALALVEFEQFAERYPASDKADDALYYIGEVYYAQGQFSEAVEAFDQVVKDYPGGEQAGPAYLKKGLALLELNRTADAVIQLQHVISAYPQSEEARIARDRLEGLGLSAR